MMYILIYIIIPLLYIMPNNCFLRQFEMPNNCIPEMPNNCIPEMPNNYIPECQIIAFQNAK